MKYNKILKRTESNCIIMLCANMVSSVSCVFGVFREKQSLMKRSPGPRVDGMYTIYRIIYLLKIIEIPDLILRTRSLPFGMLNPCKNYCPRPRPTLKGRALQRTPWPDLIHSLVIACFQLRFTRVSRYFGPSRARKVGRMAKGGDAIFSLFDITGHVF